jgi:hypothetical protein
MILEIPRALHALLFIKLDPQVGAAVGPVPAHPPGSHGGLLLDPVYTGKAMAALLDLARQGRFNTGDQVVFWHTGEAPALFAYRDVF